MWIVKNRKTFFVIAGILIAISLLYSAFFGLRFGIDFTGGALFELQASDLKKEDISKIFKTAGLENLSIRELKKSQKNAFVVRSKNLSDEARSALLSEFKKRNIEVLKSASVGPSVGSELRKKAVIAIFLASIAIILFLAYAFKEVSRPIKSWVYGFVALLALFHDIIIPFGVFSFLQNFGAEINSLFIMALLAILGYSVNDTIVVFDRIRERLKNNKAKKIKESFEETVGKALESTIARSINTSLTTALVLIALLAFGPESTRFFALTLLVGVIAGTYSSIFLASPLLVELAKIRVFQYKENKKETSKEGSHQAPRAIDF